MQIENGVLFGVEPSEAVGHIVIPEGVKIIDAGAFRDCREMTGVTIPSTVTSIREGAFSGCFELTSVTIPDGVTRLGDGAFEYCFSLTTVNLPDSLTAIGWSAFSHCGQLTSIKLGKDVTTIAGDTFCGCSKLSNISIGKGLTHIGGFTFEHCPRLKSKVGNYKAFDITPSGKLKCRDKIYREGVISFVKGELSICHNGIHYCTNLFEIFNYYWGDLDNGIAIYECDVSEKNIGEDGTSKRCARWIVPKRRLYREDVIRILNGGE